MKKFCIEVLLFTVILLCVLRLIKVSVPYYWGNDLMAHKLEYLENNNSTFDTYFIGSSNTYRHIDPIVFDKITEKSSFNLASPGMFALETEYLLENFLSDLDTQKALDVYVLKIDYNEILERNTHSTRTNYCLDTKRTLKAVKHFSQLGDYEQIYYHISGFIENQLCIGQVIDIGKYNFSYPTEFSPNIIKQKGFYPLDQELRDSKRNDLKKRNNRYLASVKKGMVKRKKKKDLSINEIAWEDLGIKDNPHSVWQIKRKPVFNNFNYFDRGHYNSKGAKKYTRQIANKIVSQQ